MEASTLHLLTIALAPLVGSLLAGLFGGWLGRAGAAWVTSLGVALSFALSLGVLLPFLQGESSVYNHDLYTWASIGHFSAHVGFMVDQLTAMMMVVVSFVSLLVHIYSIGYMQGEQGYQRFFSYISLFTFAMLMLVMSNNFMQLFFGWEAVGLVSYLLIGFYFRRPSAIFANLKAFIVNRVGDFGFLIGIAAVVYYLGSLDYAEVFAASGSLVGKSVAVTAHTHWDAATVIGIALFIGAMGKSAQVPLHVWLPDSMEGPTPISALIHAATMVTAGIFMVARMSPIYELSTTALSFILVIGATGALFTGLIGIVQNDIKRVVAYSTLSQLGYMTVALGISAYAGALFHLLTHAFFKALLFLGAGSVIIAMHHEQDMRYMGGLRRYMPVTYVCMWIGSLALCGVPFFSGFYSKDAIIEAVGQSQRWGASYAHFCVLAGAFVTALYTFRQLHLVFHGKPRFTVEPHHGEGHGHAEPQHHPGVLAHPPRESPLTVVLPLILLAIPSLVAGYLLIQPLLFGYGFGHAIHVGSDDVLAQLSRQFHGALAMSLDGFAQPPFLLVLLAFAITTYIYLFNPGLAGRLQRAFNPIYQLLEHKYWVDELYFAVFARGGVWLGKLFWLVGDKGLLDGVIVGGPVALVKGLAAGARRLQSGYVYDYAFAMIFGLVLLLGGYWMFGH